MQLSKDNGLYVGSFFMENNVTVIIPAYNAEKYIRKCIESVLVQKYKHFCILVVNDGSIDNTENIVKDYIKEYSEIICLYTKPNGGLSNARNYGIKRAKTKYVTFLDSDDYLDCNYLEILMNMAEKNNADMVCSGQYKITEDGQVLNKISYHPTNKKCLTRRLNISGKLYRLDYLNKWNINFPEGKTYEDNSFNLQCMFLTDKCYFIDYEGYYQVVHEGSITSKAIEADKLPLQEWSECIAKITNCTFQEIDKPLFEFTVLSFFTYFLFVRNRKREYLSNTIQKKDKNSIVHIASAFEDIVNYNFPNAVRNKYARLFKYKELQLQQRLGVKVFALLCKTKLLKPVAYFL